MLKKVVFGLIVFCIVINISPAFADMGKTVSLIGEGIVELPVSLVKVVGGTLKLVGEVLIFPFQAFGA